MDGPAQASARRRPAIIADRKANDVPRSLRRYLSLEDFEKRALRHLPLPIAGYVEGAVETGKALRNAEEAFRRIALAPRILRDVSDRTTQTTLFGAEYAVPFGVAPMGFSALAAYDGDVALARGAAASGSFAICSAASLTPLERVAEEGASRWFQCYVPGDNARIEALLKRLRDANYDTLVVTADVPVTGNRENNARNGFDAPFRLTPRLAWHFATHPRWTLGTLGRTLAASGMPHFENMDAERGPPLFSRTLTRSTIGRDRLTWENMSFIRERWPGRLVIKGVLCPEDATRAAGVGVDGIVVSSHGGRQLDGAIAPLDALPDIRAAVPELTVMLDGGIRRGTDVLKALAAGADFVFLGRPFLYAAAVAGDAGVAHAFRLLRQEIDLSMALLGITGVNELGLRNQAQLLHVMAQAKREANDGNTPIVAAPSGGVPTWSE
ncbi:hypothetical protein OCH239_15470 [Roseivivax halodurans JCM 10272]|uniref:FMN hydroxy acid dehydrogenase domain-containing protein n=1 Tax=Roseivivax halodurans JCM 10272 TaxID=1449350 RepID=X7ECS8_9RHOB|nr:alpha-hydroxy acid oxidase [Roseivivax halodurans]ETX12893.1 hypothetical protein OCH239_15470 [Roseivivax halodurans JCM 10272]